MSFVGGSLKLKGPQLTVRKDDKKKKRKKREKDQELKQKVAEASYAQQVSEGQIPFPEEHEIGQGEVEDRRTPAERAFEAQQRDRQRKQIQQRASKSHRERVEEFNKSLSSMTEHFDIPKVGPG
eukprot:GILJ01004336.1.p1 GENE.GILJ01004336.1~~GILJ01004336.1.p1  ORF type:complete len:137 (-),score=26.32 GILJ01004336.1:183-554(-)